MAPFTARSWRPRKRSAPTTSLDLSLHKVRLLSTTRSSASRFRPTGRRSWSAPDWVCSFFGARLRQGGGMAPPLLLHVAMEQRASFWLGSDDRALQPVGAGAPFRVTRVR
jgi:hypothetical protein